MKVVLNFLFEFTIVVNIGAIWPFYLPSAFPSLLIVSQWQSSCFTYAIQFFLLIILSFQTFWLFLQQIISADRKSSPLLVYVVFDLLIQKTFAKNAFFAKCLF